ncbi:MAG TPA: DUF1684 domain-containing protein [Bdellovibrionales bacterium]|nr:DUF1684 domain-containing protein [Bdellovibrionales bacterium]
MTKLALALIFGAITMSHAAANFEQELKTWRAEQESKLRSEGSWLAVVGLHWLKEGESSLGASDRATVVLPEPAPLKLGWVHLKNGKATLKLDTVQGVTVGGARAEAGRSYELKTDADDGGPTEVRAGSVTWFLIKRPNGVGVRVKDANAEARRNFKGRKWYAPDASYKITAKWTELKSPKTLIVPDIMGNDNEEPSPGYATFTIEGKNVDLYPTKEGDKLFFVFKDKTSGKETYGAARFLYATLPKDGKVELDFNRAVNPPCAFTDFATCPLPPKENRLDVAIKAGELKPDGH